MAIVFYFVCVYFVLAHISAGMYVDMPYFRKRTYGRRPLSGFAKKMYAKGVAKGKRLAGRY